MKHYLTDERSLGKTKYIQGLVITYHLRGEGSEDFGCVTKNIPDPP